MDYISILRGINVGGQKSIKMNGLVSLYESLGFQNAVAYIQSGNVVFNAAGTIASAVREKIETAIQEKYKFHVAVEIRTHQQVGDIIQNCPFGNVDLDNDGTKVLVTFLSEKPQNAKVAEVQKYVNEPEQLVVRDTEVYLFCPNGYGKSKLSNVFLEQKLGVEATTRNCKTICKLFELSK